MIYLKKKEKEITFYEFSDFRYHLQIDRRLSENTIKSYITDLELYGEFLVKYQNINDITYVDEEHINKLKNEIIKNKKISDQELLELLLSYSIPQGSDTRVIAKRLLDKYINISNVLTVPLAILYEEVGSEAATLISLVKACALKSIWEILE